MNSLPWSSHTPILVAVEGALGFVVGRVGVVGCLCDLSLIETFGFGCVLAHSVRAD